MRAVRYALAMLRLAWAKARGYRTLVNPVEEYYRVQSCMRCPFRNPDEDGMGTCGLCGCPLDAKILLTTEKCPKKKWLRIWVKGP